MKISISQPAYLPWLGYFNRIANSDIAIVLDSVMLERSSKSRFTNRNKILTTSGPAWLTIPILKSGIGQPLISEALIDQEQNWQEKHKRSIAHSYSKASFFNEYVSWLDDLYSRHWMCLSPLLNNSTLYLLQRLGIETPLMYSSQMNVQGSKSDLILNICASLGATTYISGPFGRDYLDLVSFLDKGITVVFDDYSHPVYPQRLGDFHSHLSIIDLLFNCGGESLDILFKQID